MSQSPRRRPRQNRSLAVLLGVLAFVALGVHPAAAEPPLAVDQLLTDRVGALGADTAEVQQALETVRAETGGALHVVLVSSFDDVASAEWIEQVAAQSDIGSSYVLLAIATEAHTYEWWLGDTAPWEVTEVQPLMVAAARPAVLAGNWAGAITAVAEGLRTGEIPAAADLGHEDAADLGHEDEASVSTSATTTAVVGFVILFLLAGYQFSRRAGARQE